MKMIRMGMAMVCAAALALAPTIAAASHDRMTEGIVAVDQTPVIADVVETAAVLTLISDVPAPVDAPVLRDDLTPVVASGLTGIVPS